MGYSMPRYCRVWCSAPVKQPSSVQKFAGVPRAEPQCRDGPQLANPVSRSPALAGLMLELGFAVNSSLPPVTEPPQRG